jgi:hypothetical protein
MAEVTAEASVEVAESVKAALVGLARVSEVAASTVVVTKEESPSEAM